LTRLSEFGISHISDNVVLLQFLKGESEVKRAITVLKTRGSGHDPLFRGLRSPLRNSHLAAGSYLTRACCSHRQCSIAQPGDSSARLRLRVRIKRRFIRGVFTKPDPDTLICPSEILTRDVA
jgi:hypothetical protein